MKAKTIGKSVILFTAKNEIFGVFLASFKQARIFHQKKEIDSFSTEGITLNQFCEKLSSYGKS